MVGAAAAPRCAPQYELEPAASATDIPVPEYGTVAWVINSCLSLIGSRAFEYGELKKAMLQAVIIVITGNGAKYNEPVLFMRIMVRRGVRIVGMPIVVVGIKGRSCVEVQGN
jgi:hypothetical protein